jgi:hypothetical protein
VLQHRDLLVGHPVPVGVGGPGPVVGEDEPGDRRRVAVEQADRPGQPLVGGRVGDDLGQPVDQHGGSRLEVLEQRPHGGPHGPTRGQVAPAAEPGRGLGEPVEVEALAGGQPQSVGQGGQHLRRRVLVAALLEPRDVLDAHAGERGDLGPAQARGPPPGPGGQPHVGRRHGFPAGPEEQAELVVAHGSRVSAGPAGIVALALPA